MSRRGDVLSRVLSLIVFTVPGVVLSGQLAPGFRAVGQTKNGTIACPYLCFLWRYYAMDHMDRNTLIVSGHEYCGQSRMLKNSRIH